MVGFDRGKEMKTPEKKGISFYIVFWSQIPLSVSSERCETDLDTALSFSSTSSLSTDDV